MQPNNPILWVVATRSSFQVDLDWDLYFAPRSRTYEPHRYIGIYHDGSVRALGEERTVVDIELDTRQPIYISGEKPGDDAIRRIEGAVEDAWERYGWDIAQGYRFFLVDRFYATNFAPVTALEGPRYLNLEKWIPKIPRTTERLALELNGGRWS